MNLNRDPGNMAQLTTRDLILIADHHPGDFGEFRNAITANGLHIPLKHVTDGPQLKDYLLAREQDSTRFPMPQLVLTEWDLPGANALEFLRWMNEDKDLPMLPIMAWTRVPVSDHDLKEAYHLGLNAFFTKPSKPEETKSVVRLIVDYWRLAEKPIVRRKR
jgi:CheY-like chemotaxis protein